MISYIFEIINYFIFYIGDVFLFKKYVYSCSYSFIDPATSMMAGIIDLHHTILFYLIIVCIIVFGLLLFLFISNPWDGISYFNHCTYLEILWTILPSFIIIAILIPSLALLHSSDDFIDPDLTIKVIGHQWYWSYEYSDYATDLSNSLTFDSYIKSNWLNLIADPIIKVPVNFTIRFLITSEDVLHSWAVPAWGVKMDAIPGRLNQIIVSVFKPGIYYGQCSEICGIGHAFMPITIEVLPIFDYNIWILKQLTQGNIFSTNYYDIFGILKDTEWFLYQQEERILFILHKIFSARENSLILTNFLNQDDFKNLLIKGKQIYLSTLQSFDSESTSQQFFDSLNFDYFIFLSFLKDGNISKLARSNESVFLNFISSNYFNIRMKRTNF